MKGLTKGFLCAGIFLSLAGGLMSLGGWLLGADTHALDDQFTQRLGSVGRYVGGFSTNEGYGEWHESEDLALEEFHALDVDVALGDVSILQGEDYGVRLAWRGESYELRYENQNGLLRVWSASLDERIDNADVTVEIYLPEGAALTGGELELSLGSLYWDRVPLSGSLKCELAMGDAEIYADLGGDVKIENAMGDIDLSGALTGKIKAEAAMGCVTVWVDGAQRDYRYELAAGMGAVRLNGDKLVEKERKGGMGSDSITLATALGDVSLDFSE